MNGTVITKRSGRTKKNRRVVAIIMLVLAACTMLTGCSRTGKCAECGQTEKLFHYVSKNTNRDEWVCNYCYNACKLFGM